MNVVPQDGQATHFAVGLIPSTEKTAEGHGTIGLTSDVFSGGGIK